MDRRTFIAALASAAMVPAGRAVAAPGISAGPDLLAAFNGVSGITEGRGRATLHVLFAPWCHISPQMYRDSRPFLDRLSIRWIPFSGGQPEGSEAVERLLNNPWPSSISAAFTKLQPLAVRPATPSADAQDMAVHSRIEPLVIRDSGKGLMTPTLAYTIGGDRVRLVLGGIGPAEMMEIANVGS